MSDETPPMTEADYILDMLKERAPDLADWLESRLAALAILEARISEIRRPVDTRGNYGPPAPVDWAKITEEGVRRQRRHADGVESFLRDNDADPERHETFAYPPPEPMSPDDALTLVLVPRGTLDRGQLPTRDEAMARYPHRVIPR